MTNRCFAIVAFLLSGVACMAQKAISDITKLHNLDLLFVVAQHSNAITDVTSGIEGYAIDHVGIFRMEDGQPTVTEAVYDGVRVTSFADFAKSAPLILVGRVTRGLDRTQTIMNVLKHLGRPYDFLYKPGDEELYCSELVTECYVDRRGTPLFTPIPMSFHDAEGHITPYWTDFYSRRGLEVPEGKPGSNPGELSRRGIVKIKYIIRDFVK